MMKHIYEKPTINIFETEMAELLTTSSVELNFYDDEEETYPTSDAL